MIDFKSLKESVGIEEVARGFLHLNITEDEEDTLRAVCPSCESSDPRAIIITPSKGLFYCFKAKKGGDLITLVSHCHGISPRDSGEELAKVYMGNSWKEEPKAELKPNAPKETGGFNPLKYIKTLRTEQEDVSEFGIIAELCEEVVGMGLCTKGINRGKLAIPLRKEDGTIVAFIGVSGDVSAPKKWRTA
jgi:DNA primase